MSVTESNIILEPVDVLLGNREKTLVTCVADSSGSLNNKYFELSTADSTVFTHYVWLNVNAAGVDPVGTGTGIEVAVATDASASVVAAAVSAALELIDGFSTKVSGAAVTIENKEIGDALAAADTGVTGFTIAQSVVGSKFDLGATEGGVSFAPSNDFVDIVADQLGSQILDKAKTGTNIEVTMTLKEVTASFWEKVVGAFAGDSITPSGGTLVVGYGESKNFTNMSTYTQELVLKPVSATDDSRNYHFWKSFPVPGTVSFSGTETQGMEVTFSMLRDTTRTSEVNLFAFGDGTQNLLA